MAALPVRYWKRVVLALIALPVFLAIAAASYQAIATWLDTRRFPEPGRLFDIGGFQLNLNCTGTGSPTVILEAGLGDSIAEWSLVQAQIARFTRVCSYDRAGYGVSDPGPMPRSSSRIAGELHRLLQSAREPSPYLLVGHSFGGYNVRVFSGKYPHEIAGLVLVDATQEDQYDLLPPAWHVIGTAMLTRWKDQARFSWLYCDLGLARLLLYLQGAPAPRLVRSKYLKARASELEQIQVSAEQARAAGTLGNKPLLVLTAGKISDPLLSGGLGASDLDRYRSTWINDLQVRLTRLSVRGKRIILPDSSHDIPHDRPDGVVNAVRELCDLIR